MPFSILHSSPGYGPATLTTSGMPMVTRKKPFVFTDAFKELQQLMGRYVEQSDAYYKQLSDRDSAAKKANEYINLLQQWNDRMQRGEIPSDSEQKPIIAFFARHALNSSTILTSDNTATAIKKVVGMRATLREFIQKHYDFLAEEQLTLQRTLHRYHAATSLMNSLRGLLADMVKNIMRML